MNPLLSHILALIVGIISGALGQFYATKFTEKRQNKEALKIRKKQFQILLEKMPNLLKEMKEDLSSDNNQIIREFIILPNKHVIFNSTKKRFVYYEEEYENLKEKIDILENQHFVVDITNGNTSLYRMSEEFIRLINEI